MIGFQIGSHFWSLPSSGHESPPPGAHAVHARHTLAWSAGGLAAHHVSRYAISLQSAQSTIYSIRFALHHRVPYGDRATSRAQHQVGYGDRAISRASCRVAYWLTQPVVASVQLAYAVTNVNPVTRHQRVPWSLLDGVRMQAIAGLPELTWAGQKIAIVQADLSSDEGSPFWLAQIELAHLADFARIAIGDNVTLTLGLETFALVIDGKTLSRDGLASNRCTLSVVSPLARLDAPFAGEISRYEPAAMDAEAAVASLIGPVAWQLPDWTIPAGRLLLENVTPLAAARNIVAAIGGIIESNPDGSVACRPRHPVSIPYYASASPDASLFDADVLAVSAQIAPQRGFNRVTVSNEDGGSGGSASSDRIEYTADEDDANQGTVRAYLGLDRPVTLVHTGHPGTVIASRGQVTRSATEMLEFVAGRSNTQYAVASLISHTWQHTNLGSLSADGQTLVAATPGYSLLHITYTTTAREWRVALSVDEEVQFVLVDA